MSEELAISLITSWVEPGKLELVEFARFFGCIVTMDEAQTFGSLWMRLHPSGIALSRFTRRCFENCRGGGKYQGKLPKRTACEHALILCKFSARPTRLGHTLCRCYLECRRSRFSTIYTSGSFSPALCTFLILRYVAHNEGNGWINDHGFIYASFYYSDAKCYSKYL